MGLSAFSFLPSYHHFLLFQHLSFRHCFVTWHQ